MKTPVVQSEIANLGRLQLKLQFVSDKRDELRIGGFTFRIGNRISKEPLEGIQITAIPCYFNGMANGTLHTGRRSLECLGDLRVQYLGDGVRGLSSPRRGFQESGFVGALIGFYVAHCTIASLGLSQ